MKFVIKHEIVGRIRIHLHMKPLTFEEAEKIVYILHSQKNVEFVKVYARTNDLVIKYVGPRADILSFLQGLNINETEVPEYAVTPKGRQMNHDYQDKLVTNIICHYGKRFLIPAPVRYAITVFNSCKYLKEGLKCLLNREIKVPVLDATAIFVSLIRRDFGTASSIMFLLGIGEILEEWTHKKSIDDLARTMSLNVSKVWLNTGDKDVLVSADDIKVGDTIRVQMGGMIPFDGTVTEGEAMINQASLTGESVAVAKYVGVSVYAGTVVEEGELLIEVTAKGGEGRYDKIVTMIEESQKLKSEAWDKASYTADKLVGYTLAGTALTYFLTGNVTKALSILMVDYSCALKLAIPVTILSAINEAGLYNITVKGGSFLEAIASADTIVFDKTGTLTKACPTVVDVVSFDGRNPDELLRIAACLEEHFPHSIAKAVVDAAAGKGLLHEEMHSKVEYIVAHGITTEISGKKAVIGSYHFVFEDEKCLLPVGKQELFDSLPKEYSHLYLAVEGKLAAVILIEDPLRDEAGAVINSLHAAGISKIVMMTGDSERTAAAVAKKVGVDEYYSEVLPEDKAGFIEEEKAKGRKVIMIGDGINDSPALSAADVGIAISDGAEIAREIADIMVQSDDLYQIVTLKFLSDCLIKRVSRNYRQIIGFNSALILLGVSGLLAPTMSALLHNTSTIYISLKSMKKLLR